MKMSELSFNEFLNSFDQKITVCRIYRCIPPSIISNKVKIQKNKFESLKDFKNLTNLKLVWYKNEHKDPTNWDGRDAKHIELKNDSDEIAYPKNAKKEIGKLIESFKKNGLTENIEIISVSDLSIGEEIIVDGVHRAVALYRLLQKEPNEIDKLLLSPHYGIYLINLRSSAASILFPCDFFNFYK